MFKIDTRTKFFFHQEIIRLAVILAKKYCTYEYFLYCNNHMLSEMVEVTYFGAGYAFETYLKPFNDKLAQKIMPKTRFKRIIDGREWGGFPWMMDYYLNGLGFRRNDFIGGRLIQK